MSGDKSPPVRKVTSSGSLGSTGVQIPSYLCFAGDRSSCTRKQCWITAGTPVGILGAVGALLDVSGSKTVGMPHSMPGCPSRAAPADQESSAGDSSSARPGLR